MMKNLDGLIKSLKTIKIDNSENKDLSFLTDDSRKVTEGTLFVAVKGLNTDGHLYINEAIKNGAYAIVGEEEVNVPENVTYLQVPDSREAYGLLCSNWFDKPSEKMKVIGVTGTDGKTTTANLIYKILSQAGKKVGLISTIGAEINGKIYDTGLHVTNPEPYQLQEFLARMVEEGCEYAVLEVTSHGIDQKRIEGIDFDISILTNITHEHLDYHKTFENYRDTKVKFLLSAKTVIVNKDDPSFAYIREKVANQKLVTYSKKNKADFEASDINNDQGLSYMVTSNLFNEKINSKLIGLYNISNCLAAIAASANIGIKSEDILKAIQSFELLEGRMQKIDLGQDFAIYVDFAHTPNALENALKTLKEITVGKLISVFGCAGERDRSKRPIMGKIASEYSDVIILTSEDPRTENVYDIIHQIKSGIEDNSKKTLIIPDRAKAIKKAMLLASKGDIVGIFGKGHEKSMNLDGKSEIPWSDKETVIKYLNG